MVVEGSNACDGVDTARAIRDFHEENHDAGSAATANGHTYVGGLRPNEPRTHLRQTSDHDDFYKRVWSEVDPSRKSNKNQKPKPSHANIIGR